MHKGEVSVKLRCIDEMLQSVVESGEVPGISYAVMRDGAVVARNWLGYADRETRERLTDGHLFRIFSNTKLVTSCALLQLVERGRVGLDDPVGAYLPALSSLRALRRGSRSLEDTEPAMPVLVRHLLTHTAGFTYAFLGQPPLADAYAASRISDPSIDLGRMVEALGRLPLLFQPGTGWNYSVATDVAGRLIEVLSGQPLDLHLSRHVLEPLGMRQTHFTIPSSSAQGLAALYEADGVKLRRVDTIPYKGAYRKPAPRLNAGGGLVSTLGDFAKLVGALQAGGGPLLHPRSMPLVLHNQLAPGQWIGFPDAPCMRGRGHSFAASVTVQVEPWDRHSVPGDVQWGGLAGTRWLISPGRGLAIVLMAQRYRVDDSHLWDALRQAVQESFC